MSVSKIFSCFRFPLLLSFIAVSLLACDKMVIGTSTGSMEVKELSEKEKFSEYEFFKLPLANLEPTDRVLLYDLNKPRFSNYAFKTRFVYLPDST